MHIPKTPQLVRMEEAQTLIFLGRALEAAGVITHDQARVAAAPKDLWWACKDGAPALNGKFQPNLNTGAIRWCFSRQPLLTSVDDTAVDPTTQGPFPHSEMRRRWPVLMEECDTYPDTRVWQDGSDPAAARHPKHFEHILGPDADAWKHAAASDFWQGRLTRLFL